MAGGTGLVVGMEEVEAVGTGFVIVGVGEPAFEGIVVERDPGGDDLDLEIDGIGQVFDDGVDLPQLAVLVALDGVEIAVGRVLDPEGSESRAV